MNRRQNLVARRDPFEGYWLCALGTWSARFARYLGRGLIRVVFAVVSSLVVSSLGLVYIAYLVLTTCLGVFARLFCVCLFRECADNRGVLYRVPRDRENIRCLREIFVDTVKYGMHNLLERIHGVGQHLGLWEGTSDMGVVLAMTLSMEVLALYLIKFD
jgi:hypothetical protein